MRINSSGARPEAAGTTGPVVVVVGYRGRSGSRLWLGGRVNGRRQWLQDGTEEFGFRLRAGICRSGIVGMTPVANRGTGDTARVIESWTRLRARGAFSAENSRIANKASPIERERLLGLLCLIR